ncbi:MAG: TetR/AcrR family transcriptional regulator [Filomicrobium sp.]
MSETREKLIDTAIDLFLTRGYGAVGTAELCRQAGVNKGTAYHFFPSKSDLLIAAIEKYTEKFRAAFERIAASDRAPEDKVRELFKVPTSANKKCKSEHGFSQGCLIANMSLELGSVEPEVRLAAQRALKSIQAAIEPIVRELVSAGRIPDIDTRRGAEIILGLIQGGIVLAKGNNDPSKIVQMGRGAIGALRELEPTS